MTGEAPGATVPGPEAAGPADEERVPWDGSPGHGLGHPHRRGGDVLLSGRGEFVDDVSPRGLLHAAFLRSPHPHATIRAVDARAARARPHVRLVLTAAEAAEQLAPMPMGLDPAMVAGHSAEFRCLAVDRVRWVGEPVAVVVATTLAEAEAALDDIRVEYELLPFVLDVEQSLDQDAPRLYDAWPDNVMGSFPCVGGDARAAIEGAPNRLDDTIRLGRHAGVPLETRGYVASWDGAGRLTFWASTQNPHPLRSNLAATLRIGEDRVRVVAPRLGGGFGHKFKGYPEEAVVCLLSKLADAPVKWIETRAESLLPGARESVHRFEAGFDDDGVVQGLRCRSLSSIGAFAAWGGWTMAIVASMAFPGPYRIKHYDVESCAVVTNTGPWAGYRGFGKEQACLVLERIMDLVASRLGLDPAEVRRRNFVPAHEFPYWTSTMHLDSGDYARTLDAVLALSGWDELRASRPKTDSNGLLVGSGLAFELCPEGGDFASSFFRGYDSATVRVQPDGTVVVLTGVTDPGTGNETSLAYLVARELGIGADRVRVLAGDTDVSPYGYGNFSSRSMATGGAAAVRAARVLRNHLADAASTLLGCESTTLTFGDGVVSSVREPEKSMSFDALVDTFYRFRLVLPGLDQPVLEVTRTEHPHNFQQLPDEHGRTSVYSSFPYSAHVAVVAVDPETGVVKVREYSVVDDCGVVVSSAQVEGQIQGAVAQGIGGALWEDMPYGADGRPLATTYKQYLLPRATDLPTLRIGHTETPSPYTLLGTKGAGESAISGAMAVMVSAVNDALAPLGATINRLPMSPPAVLDAIYRAATP